MGKTRKESRATKEGTVRKGERKEGRMEGRTEGRTEGRKERRKEGLAAIPGVTERAAEARSLNRWLFFWNLSVFCRCRLLCFIPELSLSSLALCSRWIIAPRRWLEELPPLSTRSCPTPQRSSLPERWLRCTARYDTGAPLQHAVCKQAETLHKLSCCRTRQQNVRNILETWKFPFVFTVLNEEQKKKFPLIDSYKTLKTTRLCSVFLHYWLTGSPQVHHKHLMHYFVLSPHRVSTKRSAGGASPRVSTLSSQKPPRLSLLKQLLSCRARWASLTATCADIITTRAWLVIKREN